MLNFEVSPVYLERTYFYQIRRYTIINCWLVSQQHIVINSIAQILLNIQYTYIQYNTHSLLVVKIKILIYVI